MTRLIIYEGVFRGLLVAGDQVDVSGTLQRVTFSSNEYEPFYQLMIGTQTGHGQEFIRLV